VYGSSNAVQTLAKVVDVIVTSVFSDLAKQGSKTFQSLLKAKARGSITDEEIAEQLRNCPSSSGFNLFEIFATTAHADGTCMVKTKDNQFIPFSGEDRQKCLDAYLAADHKAQNEQGRLISTAIGNQQGLANGPVVLGFDENGKPFSAQNDNGHAMYQNTITGEYFFADPLDRLAAGPYVAMQVLLAEGVGSAIGAAVGRVIGVITGRGALADAAAAQNIVNAQRLGEQLRLESASSPFTPTGTLTQNIINLASLIDKDVGNTTVPAGFKKYTSDTFQSPAGKFQVHFYKNPTTGEVLYDLDIRLSSMLKRERTKDESQMRFAAGR
jgi:hypothetical protein